MQSQAESSPPSPQVESERGNRTSSPRSTPCPGPRGIHDASERLLSTTPSATTHVSNTPGLPATPLEETNRRENKRILEAAIDDGTESEQGRVQHTISRLREHLGESTAILNNLRTRNEILRGDADRGEGEMEQAREARESALNCLADFTKTSNHTQRTFKTLICLMCVSIFVYAAACWFQGPEMSYIRQRRCEVLGLDR